jgi:UDP:flavonoid glycosyltransferase YjiC (YdhE family)
LLVDELRLGAGFAAERVGLPWVSYTHHYFDEADISEAMVHFHCQCFGRSAESVAVFEEWWPNLREAFGLGPEPRDHDQVCWWNQSNLATLVLGLPEFKVHAQPAPDYVHRVGPTLWTPQDLPEPDWLGKLGEDRPAVLVSLSTNPLPDEALAVLGSEAWLGRFDIVVTAGGRALLDIPAGVISAGDFPHSRLLPRVKTVACSAGYGAVTRAACEGVGVLAVPQMGDQQLVADAVTRSGLGYAVQPEKLTVRWLKDSLDKLLTGDGLHLRALKEAARGYDADQLSVDLIEELLGAF